MSDESLRTGGVCGPQAVSQRADRGKNSGVQNSHWLAEPINVDSLTEEGALNLLIPPHRSI
ncbi:MAG: hypothetical protein R3C56_23865 [Pirellulaceae bacterium]